MTDGSGACPGCGRDLVQGRQFEGTAQGPPHLWFDRRPYGRGTFFTRAALSWPDGRTADFGDPWPASQWPAAIVEPLGRHVAACSDGRADEAREQYEAYRAASARHLGRSARAQARTRA